MRFSSGGPFRWTQGWLMSSGPPTRGWRRGTRSGNQETPCITGPGASVIFLRLTQELEEVQNQRNQQLLTSKSWLLLAHHSEGCRGWQQMLWVLRGSLITLCWPFSLLCSAAQCVSLCFHWLMISRVFEITVEWRRTSVSTHDNHSQWLRFKNSF